MTLKSIPPVFIGIIASLGASPVLAATFETTLTLSSSGGSPFIDTIVLNWSTDLTSGSVTQNDLTNWSYDLLGGGSSVYSETVIANGVVQPIGGVPRSNVRFNFDLDNQRLGTFDTDQNAVQNGAASGVTYDVFGNADVNFPFVVVDQYSDGTFIDTPIDESGYSEVTAVVPEPTTVVGLLAFGTSLLVTKRKRQG